MRNAVVIGLVAIVLSVTVILPTDVYADSPEYTEDDSRFEFTYSDGTSTVIKITDTDIAASTVVTPEGTSHDSSVFSLQLDRMPTSVTLHTNKGEFRVTISMTLSDPGMAGQPMRLHFGDYTENLFPLGGYTCIVPSSTSEWLSPNHRYETSLFIDDGTGTFVPYDPPSGLKVSMKWESSESTRFVRFFSGGEAVGSRFYNTGDTLGEFPPASSSAPMAGWYDSFGDKVSSDTVYEYEGDMDFHTAMSFDLSLIGMLILIAMIMGICGMLITERMN